MSSFFVIVIVLICAALAGSGILLVVNRFVHREDQQAEEIYKEQAVKRIERQMKDTKTNFKQMDHRTERLAHLLEVRKGGRHS